MQMYLSSKSWKQSYSVLLMPSTLPDLINTQTPIQHLNILVQESVNILHHHLGNWGWKALPEISSNLKISWILNTIQT